MLDIIISKGLFYVIFKKTTVKAECLYFNTLKCKATMQYDRSRVDRNILAYEVVSMNNNMTSFRS